MWIASCALLAMASSWPLSSSQASFSMSSSLPSSTSNPEGSWSSSVGSACGNWTGVVRYVEDSAEPETEDFPEAFLENLDLGKDAIKAVTVWSENVAGEHIDNLALVKLLKAMDFKDLQKGALRALQSAGTASVSVLALWRQSLGHKVSKTRVFLQAGVAAHVWDEGFTSSALRAMADSNIWRHSVLVLETRGGWFYTLEKFCDCLDIRGGAKISKLLESKIGAQIEMKRADTRIELPRRILELKRSMADVTEYVTTYIKDAGKGDAGHRGKTFAIELYQYLVDGKVSYNGADEMADLMGTLVRALTSQHTDLQTTTTDTYAQNEVAEMADQLASAVQDVDLDADMVATATEL